MNIVIFSWDSGWRAKSENSLDKYKLNHSNKLEMLTMTSLPKQIEYIGTSRQCHCCTYSSIESSEEFRGDPPPPPPRFQELKLFPLASYAHTLTTLGETKRAGWLGASSKFYHGISVIGDNKL